MSKPKFEAGIIGQRLLECGYITRKQLDEALLLQKKTGMFLGEVCLLKGFVSYTQLIECLPGVKSKLGEKLIGLGYITAEQLFQAILEQRNSGLRLGEILVERGWIDRAVLEEVLGL